MAGQVISEYLTVTFEGPPSAFGWVDRIDHALPEAAHGREADDMHALVFQSIPPGAAPDVVAAFLAPGPVPRFVDELAALRQRIRDRFAAAGLPPDDRYIWVDGERWGLLDDADVAAIIAGGPCRYPKIQLGAAYIGERSRPFSHDRFALELLRLAEGLEALTGDARDRRIFRLAQTLAHADYRVHAPGVKKAAQNLRDAAAGGRERAQTLTARREKVVESMTEYIGRGLSIRRAAELCARAGIGTSAVANEKMFGRARKRGQCPPLSGS